ncbi:MAG: hypothetical protein QXP39_00990 [Candidatus Aenigmatarchaeota archaeon]
MSYKELHAAAEDFLVKRLTAQGHDVEKEKARNHDVLFDVYDVSTDTAWEVLTAKIVRSAHEQDEAIIAKIFRYLLFVKNLKFLIVSFGHEEIEMFHRLGLEHWHLHNHWWHIGELKGWSYHRGKSAREIANRIFKVMTNYAPISEWCREGRRKEHPKADVAEDFERMTNELGLPKNFLIGLWRDWRLNWVWKLENILPKWKIRK